MTLKEIRALLEEADTREAQAMQDMQIAQYANDDEAHERAYQDMLAAQKEIDVLEQAERAAVLAWGRKIDETERKALTELAGKHGLESACRVILNANSFLFVD